MSLFYWVAPAHSQVVISEFMANNLTVLQDEDAAYSDWIELHNAGGTAVDLDGWHLTDTETNLVRWTFPATNLPAGGFLLVYASGKDRSVSNLHANFSLSSGGEYLALVRPDGTTVEHEYAPAYPEQFSDISYGLQTHGTNPTLRAGEAGFLIRHTPGAANTCLPAAHPLYSDDSVAQVELSLSNDDLEWLHWGSPDSESFRTVDVRFRHGDIDITVTNAGIQCRGNTSLTQYPRSFNIAFNAFVPGQKLLDLERLNLNANVNDPSTARSKLVNDLHNAAGLPTSYANHVAVVYSNTTDHYTVFDAVRDNTQPVDDVFLRQRFGTDRGNLYKCLYPQGGDPATLDYLGPTGTSYSTYGTTYELKYEGAGDSSFNDLAAFVAQINLSSSNDFPNVIMSVFDVDGFLKRLVLDALTGHWDNYWYNGNNYHLFLNPETRRWAYVPYDFDNALGIRWLGDDWANQNIYSWTNTSGGHPDAPLAARLLAVPEFKKRYSYYMSQMLQTVYSNSILNPAVFHTRSTQTNALPFDAGSVTNMKAQERYNYRNDWPEWTYGQYYWSYMDAQEPYNSNVPNKYGITNFISTRRDSALAQLNLQDIAPILSDFEMVPSLPRSNDVIEVSIEGFDDNVITNVSFLYTFQGGSTQTVEMALQTDGSFVTNLPAFGTTGTVRYLVRAFDDTGKATTHPYGGSDVYAATIEIGSAAFDLVFSELNYHPVDPTGAEIASGFTDEDGFEFVELYNIGNSPMDLTGFSIQDGITATFPSFVLTNGEYAVLVSDTNAFRARYTNENIRIIGTYSGQLSNSGETIALEDAQGGLITYVSYSDGGSWPGRANGDGSTLEVIDFAGAFYDPDNWRSSSEYGGTPGSEGSGPDNRILINEVLSHTDDPLSDSIELFNTTESAIDIGGWFLSDSKNNYRKYAIPSTNLPAGGYIVFDGTNHFNASANTNNNFLLDGAHGDDVYLIQTDAQSNLVRFVDHVDFGAAANGESFGRWPNGSGRLAPMISRTFESINSGPRVGPVLISEILYHPPSGSNHLEFVEIENPTGSEEDLTHWELDGGVDYAFPSNTLLPAGDRLVILSFDPNASSNSALLADFRSTYGLSTNVPLVGGYDGQLDNGGERIRLLRPDEPPMEEPDFYPLILEDEVGYDDDAPWPLAADGLGASLTRLGTNSWGDASASWMATDPPTPGSAPAPLTDYQLWASANGIGDLLSINPTSDVSYAEEYLLETNAAAALQLNGPASDAYLYILLPMLEYGISNRIEISTNIVNSASWRDPVPEELVFISNNTYRVNFPTGIPFFIRTQLIPVQ